jgi:hypothetical protein
MGHSFERMRPVYDKSERERLTKLQGGDATETSVSAPGGKAYQDGMLSGTLQVPLTVGPTVVR